MSTHLHARVQLQILLALIVFCIWFVGGNHVMDEETTLMTLKRAQENINRNVSEFCYHAHSGTKQAFLTNKYAEFTENLNVLVYPFCLITSELGNRLGNYLTEVACAEASGLHFMTIHPQWDISGSFHGSMTNVTHSTDKSRLAFLNALPSIIVHKQPVDHFTAIDRIHHACHCTRYCWQHVNAPWVNRTDSIKRYLRQAVTAYMGSLNLEHGTTIDAEVDVTNAKAGEVLPIIPDVSIQYRCGDNIAFSYMYGILPFTAFPSRIPSDAKYIYVLSDHPSRAAHSPYSSRCQTILKALFDYLLEKFPAATVVVKRGGDLFLDYARLSLARVTICSASSYCFWPALANEGQVYFPLTSLIAGADSKDLAPDFGPNFHWITEVPIISNFKHYRPWNNVIDVLTGKDPIPQ